MNYFILNKNCYLEMLKSEKKSFCLPQYLVFSDTSAVTHDFYFNCISPMFRETGESSCMVVKTRVSTSCKLSIYL